MLRTVLYRTHWLVGLTAGCILALSGITGAILAFEDQIVDAINVDARTVAPRSTSPLPLSVLITRLEANHPQGPVASVTVFGDASEATNVRFAAPGKRGDEESRYVNPYTGALSLETGNSGEAFFKYVRGLHRWLMLGEWGDRDVGRQIVGACTLLLVIMCASGLYLRWPRNGQSWRAWLVPDFKLRGRAFLGSLHAAVGTWSLLFYLVIALTGLQWSYEWYRNGLYSFAGVQQVERGERRARGAQEVAQWPDLGRSWSAFLEETADSGFSRATIRAPRKQGASLEIRYLERSPAHSRAFNSVVVDPATGVVLRHDRYAETDAGGKLIASIFALHSGQFFGTPGMLAFALAALSMPLFAVTGWMLHLDRRRRKARSRARIRMTAVTQSR